MDSWRSSCGDKANPLAPRTETPWYHLARSLSSGCLASDAGVFKYDKRMPFGGFEIVGGDIRRKDGVIEFIDKDAAEEGHGALSLPRRERTPLSATGAWVPFASDLMTLRLRFWPRKVKLRSPNSSESIRADQREASKGPPLVWPPYQMSPNASVPTLVTLRQRQSSSPQYARHR